MLKFQYVREVVCIVEAVSIVLSIILSAIAVCRAVSLPVHRLIKLQEKQTNGIRCILRKEIMEIINNVDCRGFIYSDEMEVLRKLYINYHELHGNGVVDKCIDYAFSLPVKTRKI